MKSSDIWAASKNVLMMAKEKHGNEDKNNKQAIINKNDVGKALIWFVFKRDECSLVSLYLIATSSSSIPNLVASHELFPLRPMFILLGKTNFSAKWIKREIQFFEGQFLVPLRNYSELR